MGEILIVTGMSGAGKTVCLKHLEDFGFNCIDNLPIGLMNSFLELLLSSRENEQRTALGIDSRNGKELSELEKIIENWREEKKVPFRILFLDASDEVLIQRYKESRRSHPLSKEGRIQDGITKEREKMAFLRKKADLIIDTSRLLTKNLRQQLKEIVQEEKRYQNLQLSILSFGFKYGMPEDLDLLFDLRFLPNPYYDPDLRTHTGEEKAVQDFVFQDGNAQIFLDKLVDLFHFLLPLYVAEGKNQLVLGLACTGGKHRSGTMAEKLYQSLKDTADYGIALEHRDIRK